MSDIPSLLFRHAENCREQAGKATARAEALLRRAEQSERAAAIVEAFEDRERFKRVGP